MTHVPSIDPAKLDDLLRRGKKAWNEFEMRQRERHHLFVPCDQREAYEHLRQLCDRGSTFIEFGSAAGIVTILAGLLGYDAYGIEIEPWLVQRSIDLAQEFGAEVTFAEGTFVPLAYQNHVSHLSSDRLTVTQGASAYDELGLDLRDFDLVFAYPWPGEEEWLYELMRRHGRRDTTLLTYDATDGFRSERVGNL